MLTRFLLLSLWMMILMGCDSGSGAPVTSQIDAPILTSDLVLEADHEYKGIEHSLTFRYPSDWTVDDGGGSVGIIPSDEDFPQNFFLDSGTVHFDFHTMGPYVSRLNQRWRIPQPATEVAQAIANTMKEDTLIEPVTAVDINGHDGATFLLEINDNGYIYHFYIILLRITEDKVVSLSAFGPASRSEEMKTVLNAIALNIEPLEGQ
jgi:hemin uptake protein HemP